jgi:hypothetical protein
MSKWTDASTIIAAAAALWALALAWFTYVMSVRQQNQDEFLALKSIVTGLRVDLELMKDWTGAGGAGYSKTMTQAQAPSEWSRPDRMIWRFGFEAFPNLLSSPYLYRVRDIVETFARLSFSISRLFQLYDEYRSFVNSAPGVFTSGPLPAPYAAAILQFNFVMHVKLIGGADSDDPACLYKAYQAAAHALNTFEGGIGRKTLPQWFWPGHVVSMACAISGGILLTTLFCH